MLFCGFEFGGEVARGWLGLVVLRLLADCGGCCLLACGIVVVFRVYVAACCAAVLYLYIGFRFGGVLPMLLAWVCLVYWLLLVACC